jgi:hypothetical protein
MALSKEQKTQAVEAAFRLWRVQREIDQPARSHVEQAREFIESLIGRTVSPALAARVLGLSHPALKRWLDKGEIATVITPEGRREIPLTELLELMGEVRVCAKQQRPLGRVIKDRHRRAGEVDVDRLLTPRRQRGHRTAELHSLAYHRLVAERLDDTMVERARSRLSRWRRSGRLHDRWAEAWDQILAAPEADIRKAISADTPEARALRQTSPFAGALTEQERRRLVRAVEERAAR